MVGSQEEEEEEEEGWRVKWGAEEKRGEQRVEEMETKSEERRRKLIFLRMISLVKSNLI